MKRVPRCAVGILLVICFIGAALSPLAAREAEAQAPVTPTVEQPGLVFFGTSGTALATTGIHFIDEVLNGIAWGAAKTVVQSITVSTVRWINSGFHGAPAFVTDPTLLLVQVGDVAALQFFGQLNTHYISPFQAKVSAALQQNYYQATAAGGFFLLNPYTLNRFSSNPAAFLAGGPGAFGNGGWSAWFSITTNPSNNPIGSYLLQRIELQSRIAATQSLTNNRLNWGRGFLSWCDTGVGTYLNVAGINVGNVSSTPDETAAGAACQSLDPTSEEYGNCLANALLQQETAAGTANVQAAQQAALAASQVPEGARSQGCVNSDGTTGTVETPGSVIESQLEDVVGSGLQQLNLADSINEIIGALMQQLLLQVIGPNGLLGLVSGSSSGSSYADQLASDTSASSAIVASTMAALSDAVDKAKTQTELYASSWASIGAAANAAKASLNTVIASNISCTFTEGASAQAVLDTVVTPVISQASAASTKASGALSALASIEAEIAAATASSTSPTEQTAAAQAAADDYQALQASGTLPTDVEVGTAVAEDNAGDSTTLLSQMQHVKSEADACIAASSATTTPST